MRLSASNLVIGASLIASGVAVAAGGIYVGENDDAPGAAIIGILLMIGLVVLGVRAACRKRGPELRHSAKDG